MVRSTAHRLLVAASIGSVAVACHHDPAEPAVPPVAAHCVAAQPGAVTETVPLRGRITPPPGGDLPVASQVPGRIVELVVHEGQRIARGDLVARVDDVATRDAARQAEAAVAQAVSAETNAKLTLDRTRALVGRGIAAKQELDDAVAKADAARASVSAANAAADLARRTLGRVDVKSSFEGVVTKVWRGPGALVDGTAATPVVQLATFDAVEFVAEATQRQLESLKEGQPAKGELLDGHAAFEATVRVRASALDPATGLGAVRLSITPSSQSYPLGAFGRVVVETGRRDGVLLVPSTAVRGAVADGVELVICKDGKAELRVVKVGWRDDKSSEITQGLAAGEEVATEHVLGLETGTPIDAKSASPPPPPPPPVKPGPVK